MFLAPNEGAGEITRLHDESYNDLVDVGVPVVRTIQRFTFAGLPVSPVRDVPSSVRGA